MSKEKLTRTLARILLIALAIILSVMHVVTSFRVRNYRYKIAEEYGLHCKWYEEPVFYRHEEKRTWNNVTGDFILAHNVFDVSDPFSGSPRKILECGEISEFIGLQKTQAGWTIAWLLYIAPFVIRVFAVKDHDE